MPEPNAAGGHTLRVFLGADHAVVRGGLRSPAHRAADLPVVAAPSVFAGGAAGTRSPANSFSHIGDAIVTQGLPGAFGRRVKNELKWGRAVTILIAVAAAITAQRSGTMVAFLGIFGWGLFASTLVPALAVGLIWQGASRAGAMASIATGPISTLALETAAYWQVWPFPAGVTASPGAMLSSFPVSMVAAWGPRQDAAIQLDQHVERWMCA